MPRDKYEVVGPAMRRALAAAFLAQPRLSSLEWRTLAAVVTFTGTFSRLQDRMFVAQLARVVYGLERREDLRDWHVNKVGHTLHALVDRGIIGYEERRGAGKRNVSLIPDKSPDTGLLIDSFVSAVFGDKSPEARLINEEISSPILEEKVARSRNISSPQRGYSPRSSTEKHSEGSKRGEERPRYARTCSECGTDKWTSLSDGLCTECRKGAA